ncbi:hypothetical protein, partial [uncultured Gammaproteobacteria bacterium]
MGKTFKVLRIKSGVSQNIKQSQTCNIM